MANTAKWSQTWGRRLSWLWSWATGSRLQPVRQAPCPPCARTSGRHPQHWRRRGQAFMENALTIAVVAAAVIGMQVYAKRSIQGVLKFGADRLSPCANDKNGVMAQLEGTRYETGEHLSKPCESARTGLPMPAGTTMNRQSGTSTIASRRVREQELSTGGWQRDIEGKKGDSQQTAGTLGGGVSARSTVVANIVKKQ